MLVDDSAIVRGFMRRWIDEEPRIELAKACSDGAQAVAEAASIRPDVIVLDIEMPHLDGLSALPQLRKAAPDARIIMASTLTAAGATQTVKALALGASDFIAKPQAGALGSVDTYRRELIDKIVALGERCVLHARDHADDRVPFELATDVAGGDASPERIARTERLARERVVDDRDRRGIGIIAGLEHASAL